MKRVFLLTLLGFLLVYKAFSQNAPYQFNYQAVARDATGKLFDKQAIEVRVTVKDANLSYVETHSTQTNTYGLFTVIIGSGKSSGIQLKDLNWSSGATSVQVEVNAGTGYVSLGNASLLSVPYALYANEANVKNGSAIGKRVIGGGGIRIDSSENAITISNTLDSNNYIRRDEPVAGDLSGILGELTIDKWKGKVLDDTGLDKGKIFVYDGEKWILVDLPVGAGTLTKGKGIDIINATIVNIGDTDSLDDVLKTTVFSGDVHGTYDELSISLDAVDSTKISDGGISISDLNLIGSPSEGNVIKYLNGRWSIASNATSSEKWVSQGDAIYYNKGHVAIGSAQPSDKFKLEVTGHTGLDSLYVGDVIQTPFVQTDSMIYKLGTPEKGKVLTAWDNTGKVIWADPESSAGWGLKGNDPALLTNSNYLGTKSGTVGASSLRIKTNGIDRMILDSVGRTGVLGGLNIDYKNSNTTWYDHRIVGPYLAFGNANSGEGISSMRDDSKAAGNGSPYGLDFFTNFETRLTINHNGFVGVGATQPSTLFEVGVNSMAETHNVRFVAYGKKGDRALYVDNYGFVKDTTFAANAWSLQGNSYTQSDSLSTKAPFIGTTNKAPLIFKTAGDERMRITRDGQVVIGGFLSGANTVLVVNGILKTNNITESSDIRYKKAIRPIENALGKVTQLTGVSYEWRKDDFPEMGFENGEDIGLIAQEVEKILPQLVNTDTKGYKSIEYSHLVALLIEAVKEQQVQIGKLRQKLNVENKSVKFTEARMQDMEASMNAMKSQLKILTELVQKNEILNASK